MIAEPRAATLQSQISRMRHAGSWFFMGGIAWALLAPMLMRSHLISQAVADDSMLAAMSAVAIILMILLLKQLGVEQQLARQIPEPDISPAARPAKAALANQHLAD
jgi:hypothetical protein